MIQISSHTNLYLRVISHVLIHFIHIHFILFIIFVNAYIYTNIYKELYKYHIFMFTCTIFVLLEKDFSSESELSSYKFRYSYIFIEVYNTHVLHSDEII